jgi:hypothetical protein
LVGFQVFHGTEVYHVVRSDNASLAEVEQSFVDASSWLTIGTLSIGIIDGLTDRGELSLATLTDMAEKAQIVIVGAYDGEGYLVWERTAKTPGD